MKLSEIACFISKHDVYKKPTYGGYFILCKRCDKPWNTTLKKVLTLAFLRVSLKIEYFAWRCRHLKTDPSVWHLKNQSKNTNKPC